MAVVILVLFVILGLAVVVGSLKLPSAARVAGLLLGAVLIIGAPIIGSVVFVGSDRVGIVTKNAFGRSLTNGRIIATDGEMGVQSKVLAPGWHFGYFPLIYVVESQALVEISGEEVGLIEARDGKPMDQGQLFAPEWSKENFQQMLDATHFLTVGNGLKGKQASVLTPGRYRLNTELFKVTKVKQTEVKAGEVAVIKANFGGPPSKVLTLAPPAPLRPGDKPGEPETIQLAAEGEMGIRATVLPPGKYPLNTEAFTVVDIWTTEMVAHYTMSGAGNMTSTPAGGTTHTAQLEEREITVRTQDGFTFPVDVRVSYKIEPQNAPIVVARFGDDEGERFRNTLNSAVRASFRNAAEGVRALDYVQQRSQQESQSAINISRHMKDLGVTVTGVNIGNVGDEKTLGLLLKTQTDREIAKQEQITFAEQQKAAEKKKELTRVTQESEEEKKLATASYAVKIAEEDKKKRLIDAATEGESITIKAKSQADAYQLIAKQIGQSNAALIEILKIVGEKNITITPRVMITGNGAGGAISGGAASALLGTMLENVADRTELPPPAGKREEKPSEKPADKSADKSSDRPADRAADKPSGTN